MLSLHKLTYRTAGQEVNFGNIFGPLKLKLRLSLRNYTHYVCVVNFIMMLKAIIQELLTLKKRLDDELC